MTDRGFEEIPHTADWAMRVWASDLPSLFAEAARGMNTLMGARPAPGLRVKRTLEIEGPDQESLLVAFLSELLYIQEQEHLVFDKFGIQVSEKGISADLEGASLESLNKVVKAVTYHNLKIQKTTRGFEIEIVFDV